MSEPTSSPESVILNMTPGELAELLEEIGLKASPELIEGIRGLVAELGSVDAAIKLLSVDDRERRAA